MRKSPHEYYQLVVCCLSKKYVTKQQYDDDDNTNDDNDDNNSSNSNSNSKLAYINIQQNNKTTKQNTAITCLTNKCSHEQFSMDSAQSRRHTHGTPGRLPVAAGWWAPLANDDCARFREVLPLEVRFYMSCFTSLARNGRCNAMSHLTADAISCTCLAQNAWCNTLSHLTTTGCPKVQKFQGSTRAVWESEYNK